MNESMNTEPASPIANSDPAMFNLHLLPVMESVERHQQTWEARESSFAPNIPSLEIDATPVLEDPRIVEMREENMRLKQLAQYLSTYNKSLKKLIESDYSTPTAKRQLLARLVEEYGLSRRHVCRLLNLARSTCWYKSTAKTSKTNVALAEIVAAGASIQGEIQ